MFRAINRTWSLVFVCINNRRFVTSSLQAREESCQVKPRSSSAVFQKFRPLPGAAEL